MAPTRKQPPRAAKTATSLSGSAYRSAPKSASRVSRSKGTSAKAKGKAVKKTRTETTTSSSRSCRKLEGQPSAKDQMPLCSEIEDELSVGNEMTHGSLYQQFHWFRNLPTEVRQKIWSMAAPDPYYIRQRKNSRPTKGWTFTRPVPAVLHACKESRWEFLEQSDGEFDATLERRRAAHPVYKLCFGKRRTRGPQVFFSGQVDNLWAPLYKSIADRSQHGSADFRLFSGAREHDIASNLKHLTTEFTNWATSSIKYLHRLFPKLETVTILLLQGQRDMSWFGFYAMQNEFPPEVNGQLDLENMTGLSKIYLEVFIQRTRLTFWTAQTVHPDWVVPKVKFRLEKQFINNENIVIEGRLAELRTCPEQL